MRGSFRIGRDAKYMNYYVYILKSLKDGGYYIGCTTDLERRLLEHNKGKTSSLKNRRPLEIMYSETYNNSKDAYDREKKIKSYKGGSQFKKLINGSVA